MQANSHNPTHQVDIVVASFILSLDAYLCDNHI